MSAYVVDRKHIDYLVNTASNWRTMKVWDDELGEWVTLTKKELGQMLWDENVKSVSSRYEECDPFNLPGCTGDAPYLYEETSTHWPLDLPQIMKACHCLEYQSCEHPEWSDSKAKAFLEGLCKKAEQCLPGYEDAEWGAPEPAFTIIKLSTLS